ncbi:M23 family metallopeptidase [Oxalobacteraceae bacterium R-40]|uniref:M23 family metallopeptidase n=1 Tax=Keguizhuia sedimenti TaxID=3064264 RepID=A0ABU1BR13_9BURK|nr:M23 family metallopeptidase [Oxalobacteraceae bacterium R-40]
MQVILLHSRFTQAKSLTLTGKHLAFLTLAFFSMVIAGAILLHHLFIWLAADGNIPFVRNLVPAIVQDDTAKKDRYVRENLTAMATKLGEMQAQLMRLDALGERVQGLAGVKPQEFNFKEMPGRGGPETSMPDVSRALTMSEFQLALNAMSRDIEYRSDYLNVVETALMQDKIRFKLLPTIQPVNVGYNASGFGRRLDPFSGRSAFHEGIDFAAPIGTPIVAAAAGVVIASEYHHQFGNMLEIDHGNDIVTRYAHASKLHVKVGDIVRRGQHVADIGSTGRSTGAHLHFEVLVKGVQQNPHKFLLAGVSPSGSLLQAAK